MHICFIIGKYYCLFRQNIPLSKSQSPDASGKGETAIKFFIGYSSIIAARFISISQIATTNLESDRLINYLTPIILFV